MAQSKLYSNTYSISNKKNEKLKKVLSISYMNKHYLFWISRYFDNEQSPEI